MPPDRSPRARRQLTEQKPLTAEDAAKAIEARRAERAELLQKAKAVLARRNLRTAKRHAEKARMELARVMELVEQRKKFIETATEAQ